MYRYNEDTLSKWSKPASETEEKKIENTISMIKKAIKNIDYEYKYNIVRALKNVIPGNKSVKIRSNSYRVNADCVITMQYRNYKKCNSLNPNKYVEGIKYFSQDKNEIINYPKRHIENGIIKNNNTNHRYKKLVRIFKRIRNEMYEKHLVDKNKITSFLVECLIWNVPDKYINGYYSWNDRIKNSIIYILNSTNYNNWNEVSDELPLFDNNRKWSIEDVKYFMNHAYIYMGY